MKVPAAFTLRCREQYVVTLAGIIAVLVSLAGASVALWVLRRLRHRCAYNDPLCRRDRPCIACYREMFEGHGSDRR